MRILLADDEAPARRKLRRLLAEATDVEIVGEAECGTAAVDAIRRLQPDVVLLDIQMPEGDGFDVIAAIGPSNMPWTVFVTAFDAHAVRAFEVEALDYLLKPVVPERLEAALERVRERMAGERVPGEASLRTAAHPAPSDAAGALDRAMRAVTAAAGPLRHILVEHGPRSVFLPVERIEWAESDRNYVTLHAGTHRFSLRCTLQALEARIDAARFLRINRSQLVRLDAVREVQAWSHGDRHVVLQDGTRLVWSRRYRARDDCRFGVS